jgi:Putative Flp pilus-assembly TadE/G-like
LTTLRPRRPVRGDASTTGTAAADDRALAPGRCECGQVVVLFALLVPMLLALGAAVIGVGNWYVHAKHLQTKADAAVFAGGGAWGFPVAPTST